MDTEWAWMAGIIDGEGSIIFYKKTMVRLSVEIAEEDIVVRLQKIAGGNISNPRLRKGRNKPLWTWYLGEREQVKYALENLLPYLGTRRKNKANEALDRLKLNVRPKIAECGTRTGYSRHIRLGEPSCDPCKASRRKEGGYGPRKD